MDQTSTRVVALVVFNYSTVGHFINQRPQFESERNRLSKRRNHFAGKRENRTAAMCTFN